MCRGGLVGQPAHPTDYLREELAPIHAELKSIRRDLDDLREKVKNVVGFSKKFDHALERIAATEKHPGVEKKIAAQARASCLRGRGNAGAHTNRPGLENCQKFDLTGVATRPAKRRPHTNCTPTSCPARHLTAHWRRTP
jgi:hypothetical protein